jgi:hypothetical protein
LTEEQKTVVKRSVERFTTRNQYPGKNGPTYFDKPDATLGRSGGLTWLAPTEDYAGVATRADAVTATGHAPGVLQSYLQGDPIYGISVPADAVHVRPPTASDSGANVHWRPGAYTVSRIPRRANGRRAGYEKLLPRVVGLFRRGLCSLR